MKKKHSLLWQTPVFAKKLFQKGTKDFRVFFIDIQYLSDWETLIKGDFINKTIKI